MTAADSRRLPRYLGLAARGLAWSLALVAVVALVAWSVVESDWLRQRARRAIVARGSAYLDREVRLGSLDFDLVPPRVTVEDVRIAGASADAPPLATAERVTVGFGPGLLRALRGRGVIDLASIGVVRPEIHLERAADGSTNLPPVLVRLLERRERGGGGFEVRLGAIFVSRGRLELADRSLPLDGEAAGVHAVLGRLAGVSDRFRLELDSDRVATRLPALQPPASEPLGGRLSLVAILGGGAVEVSRLELRGELADLEGSGRWSDGRLEATLTGLVDSALLRSLGWADAVGAGSGALSGNISLDGRATWEDGSWTVATDLATSEIVAGPRRVPALTGRLEAAGRGAEVEHFDADLADDELDLSLRGSYRDARLALSGEGWVETALAADLSLTDEVSGRLHLDGDLELAAADDWRLAADLSSDELRYRTYVIEQASGRLAASPGAVRVESIAASAAGGSVGGTVTVDLEAPGTGAAAAREAAAGPEAAATTAPSSPLGYPQVTLDLTSSDIAVRRFIDMAALPVEGLAGRVSGELLYRFETAEPQAGRGHGRLRFTRLDVTAPAGGESRPVQLAGEVPVTIDHGVFRTEGAKLSMGEERLTLTGELAIAPADGPGPRLRAGWTLATRDPRRVMRLIPALYASDPNPLWEPQAGHGNVQGTIVADPDGFELALDVDLADAVVAATRADRVRGTLAVDSAGIQAVDLAFRRGAPDEAAEETGEEAWSEKVDLVGSIPFSEPRPGFEPPPFTVRIETADWPLAEAAPWLPFELPADGRASAVVELGGELDALTGTVEGSVTELATNGLEVDGTLTGSLAFSPEEVRIEAASLEMPAGRLALAGTYGLTDEGTLDLELVSDGLDVARPPFALWLDAPVQGTVTVHAEIEGTASDPRLQARLLGDGLAVGESELGRGGESLLDLTWRGGELTAHGSLLGLVRLDGSGRLDAEGSDVALTVESDQVGSLLALVVGVEVEDAGGSFHGTLRLEGAGETLGAKLELDRLSLTQAKRRLANLEPVVLTWQGGVLRLDSLFLGEESTDTDLFVSGDLVGPEGQLDLVVQSTIDASWLALYLPDVDLSGQVNVLGVVKGSLSEPALDGQADLEDARMIVAGFPHAFERMSGLLFFYPDRVVVDSGKARLAGGRVTADGSIELVEKEPWSYELRLRGRDLDLRYPEDWRLQGDLELTLASTPGGRQLTGVVTLERAAYLRDFKLGFTGLLRTLFERRAETVAETEESLVQTQLNILVRGPEALEVKTSLADLQGNIDFSVRGTLADPVLLGDVRLLRGGKIDIGGAEYTIERGTLSFSNPYVNTPRIDLVTSAQVKEYDVRLNVYGPLDHLETSFSSNPPLADVDIVSLLTTGSAETLGSLGSTSPTGGREAGAESFLAGQAASLAGERVGSLLGLDQVRISPLTGGAADLSTARLTVGKRLGRDLFVTYSYDPSRSQEEIYELSWQVAPSVALILTRSDQGSFAVDLKWNKTF